MARRQRGARIVERLLKTQARARALYGQADQLLDQIRGVVEPGDTIDLGNGRVARLVDQFADRSKVFHATACSRFKVEIDG